MPLVKAKTKDGQEIEVELPEEYAPRAEVTAQLDAVESTRFAKRMQKFTDRVLDEYTTDEKKRAELLKRLGIDPTAPSASSTVTKQEREAWQREFEDTRVKPLAEKLTAAEKRAQQLLERSIEADIVAAASAAKVKPFYLQPGSDGKPRIVKMLRDEFGHDDETEGWYARQGERFRFSTKDSGQYMPVSEWFTIAKTDPNNGELFEDQRQSGAALQRTANASTQITTRSQLKTAADHSRFISDNGLDAYQKLPA